MEGGGGGYGVWRWGKREIMYLSLHCYHQNDSCIKMGSDVSHFNVSLVEEKGKPKRIRTEVPLLTSLTPYRYTKPVRIYLSVTDGVLS